VGSLLSFAVPYLADALVILGLFVMTIGVYGVIRMPDTYTRLHAASKAVFLGVISFCASSVVTGDLDIIYRTVLITAFVIARAAFLRGERMETPGALDESGKNLSETPGYR
jgi:multicomponent Na+:H+ antiporter subunit G